MQQTTLAKYLHQKRNQAGLSIEALAEMLQIARDRVEAWESTEETPPSDCLMEIIAALQIDELEMFDILAQDSMERWRSVLLAISGNRQKSG